MLKDIVSEDEVNMMLKTHVLLAVYKIVKEFIEDSKASDIDRAFKNVDDVLKMYHESVEESK